MKQLFYTALMITTGIHAWSWLPNPISAHHPSINQGISPMGSHHNNHSHNNYQQHEEFTYEEPNISPWNGYWQTFQSHVQSFAQQYLPTSWFGYKETKHEIRLSLYPNNLNEEITKNSFTIKQRLNHTNTNTSIELEIESIAVRINITNNYQAPEQMLLSITYESEDQNQGYMRYKEQRIIPSIELDKIYANVSKKDSSIDIVLPKTEPLLEKSNQNESYLSINFVD